MAISYVQYTATTGTGPFAFTFPYISIAHVKVSKNGTPLALTTGYTISTTPTPTVTLVAPLVLTDTLKIYRQTPGLAAAPNNAPLVDFTDGSVLTAADLDKNTQQLLYLVQEANEAATSAFGPTSDATAWDAGNKRIKNLADGIDPADAVTRGYVDDLALYGVNQPSGQAWAMVGDGSAVSFALTSPVPTAADPDLFLVEVGGVLQHPTVNYLITVAGGVYSLTFDTAPASGATIRARNLGVSRGTLAGTTLTVGVDVFAVDVPNERVGVGTASPQTKLSIHNSDSATSRLELTNSLTGNAAAEAGLLVALDGAEAKLHNKATNGTIDIGNGSGGAINIATTGKVGIGTTSANASYLMDVRGPMIVGNADNITASQTGVGHLSVNGNGYTGFICLDGTAMQVGHNSAGRTLKLLTNEAARLTVAADGARIGLGVEPAADAAIQIANASGATTSAAGLINQTRLHANGVGYAGLGTYASGLTVGAVSTDKSKVSVYVGTDPANPIQAANFIPSGTAGLAYVGINKSSPTAALDVVGSVGVSSDLVVGGNAAVTGTLGVTGATTMNALTVGTTLANANVTINGNLSVTGTYPGGGGGTSVTKFWIEDLQPGSSGAPQQLVEANYYTYSFTTQSVETDNCVLETNAPLIHFVVPAGMGGTYVLTAALHNLYGAIQYAAAFFYKATAAAPTTFTKIPRSAFMFSEVDPVVGGEVNGRCEWMGTLAAGDRIIIKGTTPPTHLTSGYTSGYFGGWRLL